MYLFKSLQYKQKLLHSKKVTLKVVPLGEAVELCCQVVGVPRPRVEWYHNGERIGANDKSGEHPYKSVVDEGGREKEWNSTLRVAKVGSEDTGSYVCNATNRLGSYLSEPAYIKILGKFIKIKNSNLVIY